jgi:ATP-dependent Zn protease
LSYYEDHVAHTHRKDRCAWHEAGHVLAGIKLGSGVERVELFPDRLIRGLEADGVTTFKDFHSLSRADAIKCLLAGPLAERRIDASSWP